MKLNRLANTPIENHAEYVGSVYTHHSIKAMMRYFQSGTKVVEVCLLTSFKLHSFVLIDEDNTTVFVRAGFTSGYPGEGPRGLEFMIRLIESFGIEIDEYEISPKLMEKINAAKLTLKDINILESLLPVRPIRHYEYIRSQTVTNDDVREWAKIPISIPYALIDHRIKDIVIDFNNDPDSCLIKGYRRLEQIIKDRTGQAGNGVALLSKVFDYENGKLCWDSTSKSEHEGRGSQFSSCFKMFRNDRIHNERASTINEYILELIFLNNLFVLERKAKLKNIV